jgi:glucose-1-phosphate cytidylyltransferase
MIPIGHRPILWHLMKYYAHYGHQDFIICLGYKADAIKSYFLNYDERLANDFVLSDGGNKVQLLNRDIQNWKITFVDTGMLANIGQRLKAVEEYLEGEETFLANYSDGLTDLPLPEFIDWSCQRGKIASFLCVRPAQSFHVVTLKNGDGQVSGIQDMSRFGLWINGGFFLFRQEIFAHIRKGEELVQEPFSRLIQKEELMAYQYEGFWACMDTFKDKQQLDDLYAQGAAPWEVWKTAARTAQARPSLLRFAASVINR